MPRARLLALTAALGLMSEEVVVEEWLTESA